MDDVESAFVVPFLEQPRTITSGSLDNRSSPDRMTPRLLVGPITPPTGELADVSTIDSKCDEDEIAHDSSQIDLDHHPSSVAHRGPYLTLYQNSSIEYTEKRTFFFESIPSFSKTPSIRTRDWLSSAELSFPAQKKSHYIRTSRCVRASIWPRCRFARCISGSFRRACTCCTNHTQDWDEDCWTNV